VILVNVSTLNLEKDEKYDLLYRLELLYSEFLKRKTDYLAENFRSQIKEIPIEYISELLGLEPVSMKISEDHPKVRYTKEWDRILRAFSDLKDIKAELEVKKNRIISETKKLFSLNKIIKNYFHYSEVLFLIEEDFVLFSDSTVSSMDIELYFYKVVTQLYVKTYCPTLFDEKRDDVDFSLMKDKNKFLHSWITNYFFFIFCLDNFKVSGLLSENGYKGILKSSHPLSKKIGISEKSYLYLRLSIEPSDNQTDPISGNRFVYPSAKKGLSYVRKTELNKISSFFELKIKPNGLKIRLPFFVEFAILQAEDGLKYSKSLKFSNLF
jgi:hypothetical protein